MSRRCAFPLALSLLAVGAAGCFTHPINRAPVITQISQVGNSSGKGQDATFMAVGSDPDQDQVTWTWAARPGKCGDRQDPGVWPRDTVTGEPDAPATYVVTDRSLTASAQYCVWAFATDRYGAIDAANVAVFPADNPPVATIQMLVDPDRVDPPPGPLYPAHSTFQLTAQASDPDDGDVLKYTWAFSQMPAGAKSFLPCTGPNNVEMVRCFTADVQGTYSVSLTVSDGMTTTQAVPVTVTVLGDAPPCIDMTEPMFAVDPTMPTKALTTQGVYVKPTMTGQMVDEMMIKIDSVYDDINSFPAQPGNDRAHFTWYTGKNDTGLQYVDNVDYMDLPVSSSEYKPGDYVNVRLEVKDQNPAAIEAILASCGDQDFCATPTIPPGRTECWVRVSWRIHLTLTQ